LVDEVLGCHRCHVAIEATARDRCGQDLLRVQPVHHFVEVPGEVLGEDAVRLRLLQQLQLFRLLVTVVDATLVAEGCTLGVTEDMGLAVHYLHDNRHRAAERVWLLRGFAALLAAARAPALLCSWLWLALRLCCSSSTSIPSQVSDLNWISRDHRSVGRT